MNLSFSFSAWMRLVLAALSLSHNNTSRIGNPPKLQMELVLCIVQFPYPNYNPNPICTDISFLPLTLTLKMACAMTFCD